MAHGFRRFYMRNPFNPRMRVMLCLHYPLIRAKRAQRQNKNRNRSAKNQDLSEITLHGSKSIPTRRYGGQRGFKQFVSLLPSCVKQIFSSYPKRRQTTKKHHVCGAFLIDSVWVARHCRSWLRGWGSNPRPRDYTCLYVSVKGGLYLLLFAKE